AGFSPSAARFSRAGCRGCVRDISASSPPRSSGPASSRCCPTSRGTSAESLAPRGGRAAVRRPGAGQSGGAAVGGAPGRRAPGDARRVAGGGARGGRRGGPPGRSGARRLRRAESHLDRAGDGGVRRLLAAWPLWLVAESLAGLALAWHGHALIARTPLSAAGLNH